MTSSLVGSEMCIRDSESSVCQEDLTLPQGPKEIQELWFASSRLAVGAQGCLLYTSDAADDM
eukprot:2627723-Prorocentrum_lima.AAC.1